MVAADGLGVVAAGVRVVIFGGTLVAHGEVGHGGAFAVVGRGGLNREARAAVGAVDERMEVTAVRWIVELFGAGVAGGDVGRDVDRALFAGAFDDLEIGEGRCGRIGEFFGFDVEDDGARGRIVFDCVLKIRTIRA